MGIKLRRINTVIGSIFIVLCLLLFGASFYYGTLRYWVYFIGSIILSSIILFNLICLLVASKKNKNYKNDELKSLLILSWIVSIYLIFRCGLGYICSMEYVEVINGKKYLRTGTYDGITDYYEYQNIFFRSEQPIQVEGREVHEGEEDYEDWIESFLNPF